MDCQETQSLMGAYLDSELDVRSVHEVREHLTACAGCAKAFAAEEQFHRQLNSGLKGGRRTDAVWEGVEEKLTGAAVGPGEAVLAGNNQAAEPKGKAAASWVWWLWPSPRFYAGLAALWLLLLPLHVASRDPAPARPSRSASVPLAARMVLVEQRRLLTELLGAPRFGESETSPQPTVRPGRSERSVTIQNIRV